MTIFLLWACLESIYLIRKKKVVWGAFILALAIDIKILPLVMIPYLVYRSYYKGTAYTLFLCIVLLFLPGLVVGWSTNLFLLSEWWNHINPTKSEHILEVARGAHSLTAMLPPLLTETQAKLDIQRNILSLSPEHAMQITNVLRFSLIIFSLYFLKWTPFRTSSSRLLQLRELSYLLLLIPLIFPRQQNAHVLCIEIENGEFHGQSDQSQSV